MLFLAMAAVGMALPAVAAAETAEDFRPALAAFELSAEEVRPGGTLWTAYEFVNAGTTSSSGDCRVFVHVRPAVAGDPDIKPGTGGDFQPLTPTLLWRPGAVARQPRQALAIPADLPPGRYRIYIGLFDPHRGQRYALANPELAAGGNRYRVAEFSVVAPGATPSDKPVIRRWRDTAGLPDAEEAAAPPAPSKTVVLDSGALRVTLDAQRPAVVEYRLPGGPRLSGDRTGHPWRATLGREGEARFRAAYLADPSAFALKHAGLEARYGVTVRDGDRTAARLDLVFRLRGTVLRIGVENVREEPGYLLMEVLSPQLVSVAEPAGQLVLPTQGGRLVPLERAAPGRHTIALNWHEVDLCGAVVGEGCAAAVRSRDWDNQWEARVSGAAGKRHGGFAARLALRAESQANAARIRLAEAPSVEVAVVPPRQGPARWTDAAAWLREEVPGPPTDLYRETYLYKIFCDSPGAKNFTRFDEALEFIRRVHRLAPWLKQVVYLVGWQYSGHDTGYPATDRLNARLGSAEDLRRLAAEARRYNAVVSFHDNFDDAYRDSPQWDESLVARDPRGELQKGGVWAGGQSYILALEKYARQAGVARVRRTVAELPVRESYHIDVLSAVPLRRDYHPQAPESTRQSLAGKRAIVAEFNRLGIDVTSEGFTAPLVGAIGHAWHFWRNNDPVLAGDEPIPFIPMIYHGGPTTYGRGGKRTPHFSQESVLYGASFSTDWTHRSDLHAVADPIYRIVVPWTYLRNRRMEDYRRQGDVCRVTYDQRTLVETDRASGRWRVMVDGHVLVEDDLVVVPKGDLVAVYASTARTARVALPPSLVGKRLAATNGCTGEDATAAVRIDGSTATVELAAREPLLIRAAATP